MDGQSATVDDVRLPAVDRALDLLELLSSASVGVTLAEASRKLGIPKSTAHYLIYTLLRRDYIRRNSDGRTYTIGPRATGLGNVGEAERQMQALARPELCDLSGRFNLTALLGGLKGAEVVRIGHKVPSGVEDGGNWTGLHAAVHCTSLGKALIAHLPDSEMESLLYNRPLPRYTVNTICSLELLREHLARVRATGFAVNDEEHIIGIRGVSAPVFDHIGKVVAAVCLTGSAGDIPRSSIPKVGKDLISVASELSRKFLEGLPAHA